MWMDENGGSYTIRRTEKSAKIVICQCELVTTNENASVVENTVFYLVFVETKTNTNAIV